MTDADRVDASTSSSASSTTSYFPIPRWVAQIFMHFPLVLHDSAKVYDPHSQVLPVYGVPSSSSSSPSTSSDQTEVEQQESFAGTLYVKRWHPRPRHGRDGKREDKRGWASSDVDCLEAQMLLLATQRSFHVMYLEDEVDESWGPGGELPFLQTSTGGLISKKDVRNHLAPYLPHQASAQEASATLSEKEMLASGSSAAPYEDAATLHESHAWASLITRQILAGVLLLQLHTRALAPPKPKSHGFLSAPLHSRLAHNRRRLLQRRIYSLSNSDASSTSFPLSRVPGWGMNLSLDGLLGSVALPGEEEDEAEQDGQRAASRGTELSLLEESRVFSRASEGIRAVAQRFEQQDDRDAAQRVGKARESRDAPIRWFLGAKCATPLDCALFACLHTILSLPTFAPRSSAHDQAARFVERQEQDKAQADLRKTIEDHPVLLRWTRSVWKEKVKPLGG
ncbi:hypothetical protein IE81DRAFT_320320 [Ceraceosorus guamensis]|uniref:Mitochondrial outer membrane transport complex Sam37/metaxin N-terminal domain-containing protein n=1 Tax=Ceraceosorus guamensis TaxID=1522189 RepID=A0A316WCF1_9BASI|nr:hypothetical protein IE81DRAFT_320320 [Ceraceosorus guamensis]PWN45553.1 hypothetical protein IE81DRAFT_320320 [Ceraceosorus guamensis]